jgi:hypothetical protein
MRIVAVGAVVLPLLAGPALSQPQIMDDSGRKSPLEILHEQQKKEQAEVEKRYDATMKHLRSKGPAEPSDPWRGVRPAETRR